MFGAFVNYRDQVDGHPIRLDVGTVPPEGLKSADVDLPSAVPDDWQPEFLMPALYLRDTRNRWWHRNMVGYLRLHPGAGNDGF